MKKLMITAAAALTATIGFSVESSNVVGYMQKEMAASGYYNYTPMFVSVDGTDPKIKEIVPSSTEASDLSGGVIVLYKLQTNRKFAEHYQWFTEDDLFDQDGWYDDPDATDPTEDVLGPGESVQVWAPYQVTFTYAGAVDQAAYDFTAPAQGYYNVGNQHATAMNIKDIVPSSTAASDLSGGVIVLYKLQTNRKFAEHYQWFTEDDLFDQDGWYDDPDATDPTTDTLAPGEVVQMWAPYQVKLSFPAQ